MPEDSDYTPAPWSAGTSFSAARSAYDSAAGRSYSDAVTNGLKVSDLVPDKTKTNSENPIVILCDVTGSMGAWPATIFSKLPYLDHEAKFYFGKDYAICFGAIGDSNGDRYPLQVQPFGNGKDMKDVLSKLIIEGGGGGTSEESYNLGAVYFSENCEMPNAVRPVLIFIGDEGIYPTTSASDAENLCKVANSETLDTKEVFEKLKQKFEVFVIRKTYSGASEHRIQRQWEDYLGEDHVAMLQDPNRVVDVIFGVFAKMTGKIEDFKKELEDRQGKDDDGDHKIKVTLKALNTIHRDASKSMKRLPAGAVSVTRRSGAKGKASKSLLNDDE